MASSSGPLSYCAAEVRRHDPERFVTALFAPRERREALLALYAFNSEIARIRELVREPMLGQIRLQWWRETIAGIYEGKVRRHAVVEPLAAAIREHALERSLFERLIEAREADFADAPPADLAALERYASESSATLTALALAALGADAEAAAPAAEAAGIGWALVGLLRAVPFHARQRRLYLPADLLAAAGVEAAMLFEEGATPGLPAVVREIAARAERRLAALEPARRALPRSTYAALLPAVLARFHLRALRRAGYDPFALAERPKRPLALLRLALAAFGGPW